MLEEDMDTPRTDPVLNRFRDAVRMLYGERLDRVVLFGSRARGDSRADSDYDIAVFLREMPDRAGEFGRLADVETGILLDTGALINALPFLTESYQQRTIFMGELRRDGLDL
jgi:uncharacterized protein